MKRSFYEVTDDSGFLAIIDPVSYRSFVHRRWTLDQVVQRFKEQMRDSRMLIWGTGREGNWRVDVGLRKSLLTGFREFTAPLTASGDRLLLTNFESLTMAAQFEDVRLPEAHQTDLLIPVLPGSYRCRVVQLCDPESDYTLAQGKADFRIELTVKGIADEPEELGEIPWAQF